VSYGRLLVGSGAEIVPYSLIPVTILGTIALIFGIWLKVTDPDRPRGRRKQ